MFWNLNKPQLWSACRKLNRQRRRTLASFVKEHESEAFAIFSDAIAYAAADKFWSSIEGNFDMIFTKNHVITWSEGNPHLAAHLATYDQKEVQQKIHAEARSNRRAEEIRRCLQMR